MGGINVGLNVATSLSRDTDFTMNGKIGDGVGEGEL
jgi:hypothetical protein